MFGKGVRVWLAGGLLLALVAVAAGCGGGGGGGGSKQIALLLPENHTPRYESSDKPNFEAKVKELCSDCKVLYSNATQDASKQQSQAEAALTQGADVLVVDAVDAGSPGAIVGKAKAQNEMQQAITALGNNGFAGVLGANDDLGGAAVAAMKGAGIKPSSRPTTGQDATVAGLQRILIGDQYMTVWKPDKPEANAAAEIAVALAKGDSVKSGLVNQQVNNGKKDVPSVILKPVAVVKSNINDTVVKDGFWTAKQICVGKYAQACKTAGISGS